MKSGLLLAVRRSARCSSMTRSRNRSKRAFAARYGRKVEEEPAGETPRRTRSASWRRSRRRESARRPSCSSSRAPPARRPAAAWSRGRADFCPGRHERAMPLGDRDHVGNRGRDRLAREAGLQLLSQVAMRAAVERREVVVRSQLARHLLEQLAVAEVAIAVLGEEVIGLGAGEDRQLAPEDSARERSGRSAGRLAR